MPSGGRSPYVLAWKVCSEPSAVLKLAVQQPLLTQSVQHVSAAAQGKRPTGTPLASSTPCSSDSELCEKRASP